MRRIAQQRRFRQDLRRQKRRGRNIEDLIEAVELLDENVELPPAYRPHKLVEQRKGVWECHIEADWLLIYSVTAREVLLIRTGSHRHLFG